MNQWWPKSFSSLIFLLIALATNALAQQPQPFAPDKMETVLYGVAYYPEYMPHDRLDQDIELMRKAGITVVRVGESTWSSWEPREGDFQFAWMQRVLDRLQQAGIKAILGTPTYSIPTWLYKQHPEIVVTHNGVAPPLSDPYSPSYPPALTPGFYGPRQNYDFLNPYFRQAAEGVIRQIISHFKDHPAVIGYQIDNETFPTGIPTRYMNAAFLDRLKQKYKTPAAINSTWGLVYWGQLVDTWESLPPRDGILNPGYKLEWENFQHDVITDYLAWQAKIVNEYKRPNQFITQDFSGGVHTNLDQWAIAHNLDIVAENPYFQTQQRNMVEYWHWHSLHYGQETYWKGVLSHDLEPNRTYDEVSRVAAELKKIGPQLVDLKKENKVAILFSADSANAISYMPFSDHVGYMTVLRQMYDALYDLNVEPDFVSPDSTDLSTYRVLLVPPLYSASDAVLQRVSDYVKNGGHVVMSFKSGFTNEYSTARDVMAPGPLRTAAGFHYQEFTNLAEPQRLKPDPFGVGEQNKGAVWEEFLIPDTAQVLASFDDPYWHFPAVTRNRHGAGTLTYEGSYLTEPLQREIIRDVLRRADLTGPDQNLPAPVKVRHGRNGQDKLLHNYLNFSGEEQSFSYPYGKGAELLTNSSVQQGEILKLRPWDLAIVINE